MADTNSNVEKSTPKDELSYIGMKQIILRSVEQVDSDMNITYQLESGETQSMPLAEFVMLKNNDITFYTNAELSETLVNANVTIGEFQFGYLSSEASQGIDEEHKLLLKQKDIYNGMNFLSYLRASLVGKTLVAERTLELQGRYLDSGTILSLQYPKRDQLIARLCDLYVTEETYRKIASIVNDEFNATEDSEFVGINQDSLSLWFARNRNLYGLLPRQIRYADTNPLHLLNRQADVERYQSFIDKATDLYMSESEGKRLMISEIVEVLNAQFSLKMKPYDFLYWRNRTNAIEVDPMYKYRILQQVNSQRGVQLPVDFYTNLDSMFAEYPDITFKSAFEVLLGGIELDTKKYQSIHAAYKLKRAQSPELFENITQAEDRRNLIKQDALHRWNSANKHSQELFVEIADEINVTGYVLWNWLKDSNITQIFQNRGAARKFVERVRLSRSRGEEQ